MNKLNGRGQRRLKSVGRSCGLFPLRSIRSFDQKILLEQWACPNCAVKFCIDAKLTGDDQHAV